MPSIKKNFLYNLILTLSTYVFGLVVFPYVSRVLGVDNIGKVNFADQTIKYIMLFAAMGVATVGVREIAACGDDRVKRSEVFSNILCFISLLSALSLVVLFVLVYSVPRFADIQSLLVMGPFYIIGTTLLIEWFYQGLENFRFVAIRTIIVKVLYVAAVFLFVKTKEDYRIYYFLSVLAICINAAINIFYSRKFVDFSFRGVSLKRYSKPILSLGIYMIMLSFFTTFNVLYLGFVHDDHAVGVYSTSIKIYSILLGVVSAFTMVMMPRMSSLLSGGKKDDFTEKISISFDLVFSVSIPLAVGGVVLAPQIVSILAGPEYGEAVLPMRIIMPNLFIISCAQIWVMQILLPMKRDRLVTISSVCAALVGVALNIVLVGKLSAVGSAIVLVAAELCGDTISFVYAVKNRLLRLPPFRKFARQLAAGFLYAGVCSLCTVVSSNDFISFSLAFVLCAALFVGLNCVLFKDGFIYGYSKKILRHA